jgi:hypothetical protein
VICLHVEIYKYRNVGGFLFKKIEVKLRRHTCMLREFKLMIFSEFYLYIYIGLSVYDVKKSSKYYKRYTQTLEREKGTKQKIRRDRSCCCFDCSSV